MGCGIFGFFFKQRRVYREKISSHSVPSHPLPLSQTVNVDTALGVLPETSCTRKSTYGSAGDCNDD